jgi:hypothetical protein
MVISLRELIDFLIVEIDISIQEEYIPEYIKMLFKRWLYNITEKSSESDKI